MNIRPAAIWPLSLQRTRWLACASLAMLFSAVGVLAPVQAHAAACDDFAANDRLAFRPFVLSAATDIRRSSGDCTGMDQAVFTFTNPTGARVATVRVRRTGDHIDLRFQFDKALPAAKFGTVTLVRAQSLELLNLTATKLRGDAKIGIAAYYPYNWRKAQKRAVRDGDSITPGFKANRQFIVYDTPKLGAIAYQATPGKLSAYFPYFDEYNQKGDKARSKRDIRAGESKAMRFYVHASLAHIQDQRFGAPDRRGMQNADIAQFVPNQWTPSVGKISRRNLRKSIPGAHCGATKKGRGRTCFATNDEMEAFAAAMPPQNSIVIARIALPLASAARAIKAGGASPFYYLFAGAIATRDGDIKRFWPMTLRDSDQKRHLAPYSHKSKGHWLLLDITQKDVRAAFIARAVEAMQNGYEGIFMDGAFLWNMPNGHVGGDNPNAKISNNHARHLMMRELKAAMRAVDPHARLGLLANRYQEYMHYADFVVREGTSLRWSNVRAAPHRRAVRYDPAGKAQKGWHSRYGRMATTPVFFACKGPNPVLVRSCRQTIDVPHAGFYYDSGDWPIYDSEIAVGLVRAIYDNSDLYVTRTEGNRPLLGLGVSRLSFPKTAARIWFSRAAPVLRVKNWTALKDVRHTMKFAAGEAYIPASHDGPDGWSWANEGFIYRDSATYIAGSFYVTAPIETFNDGARFEIAAEPRFEAEQDTRRGPKAKPADTAMTIHIRLPVGGAFHLEDLQGRSIQPDSVKRGKGRTIVKVTFAGPVFLVLTGL